MPAIKSYFLSLFGFMVLSFQKPALAQNSPFEIRLDSFSIEGLVGIQSFAYGTHEGKWVILGGRLDGLHRRQQFASFDIPGHNSQIWVVDPETKQKWNAPLSSLSVALQDQLSSTNMEFHQQGNFLYCVGGYGYSAATATRKTYDKLTAIDLSGLVNAVVSGAPIAGFFRQISHPNFAVTGGHLNKIYDTWYLVGGQKFDGNYNPMGNPTYTQEYTNAIRKFTLVDDGTTLTINHLPSIVDAANLHRRDYNVSPQIMPDGKEGLTAFSGVFQPQADIPFLNCVNIDSSGYSVEPGFAQYFNHYHCANLAVFSESTQEMHTVFFGGIAQYYESQGTLIQDNNVPFVKTIARVTRTADGQMAEYKLPVEMPGYLGSGSEFILRPGVEKYGNGVVKMDEFQNDTTFVGYIFGGISSSAANIFFTNTGTESSASGQIFKVMVIKNQPMPIDKLNAQSKNQLQFQVYPNPATKKLQGSFILKKTGKAQVSFSDNNGKLLKTMDLGPGKLGENKFEIELPDTLSKGIYQISLQTSTERVVQKVVLKP